MYHRHTNGFFCSPMQRIILKRSLCTFLVHLLYFSLYDIRKSIPNVYKQVITPYLNIVNLCLQFIMFVGEVAKLLQQILQFLGRSGGGSARRLQAPEYYTFQSTLNRHYFSIFVLIQCCIPKDLVSNAGIQIKILPNDNRFVLNLRGSIQQIVLKKLIY